MKFYQNIRYISSLITMTGVLALTCFSVSAMAKGSSAAMVTTTTTTTETTTEETTQESTTEETTAEVFTNKDGSLMSEDEINVYKIVKKATEGRITGSVNPEVTDTFEEKGAYIQSKRSINFTNGDYFNILRYEFNDGNTAAVEQSIDIPGSTIEIRYVDANGDWYMSTNPQNTAKTTMYIDTDKCSLAIGVPAVYKDSYLNNTLEVIPEQESGITIEKTAEGYSLKYSYPGQPDTVGEIWYLYSSGKLADWNNADHFKILNQDMSKTARISYDGYYYTIPYNYEPYSENMLYRHPADYIGTALVKYGDFPAANELAYAFISICAKNQNTQGFWATGPKSEWLSTDFNIGAGFYDTRFNTDFAGSLIEAYKRYGNEDFLTAAVKYGEYFKQHAQNHSYITREAGILVEDYGTVTGTQSRTHVSLNHQLAELNFLYQLYDVTGEESYRQLADKMLKGIEDTQDQWVLADNNLNYALHYTGTYNTMKDYPYLTYNDLYTTKKLLNNYFNRSSATIDYLMACKLEWMQANNVTGYYTN
jgi:hypothetical protein